MNGTELRDAQRQGLELLLSRLETGESEGYVEYLKVVSRFHRYSWGNTILIASQRPDATRVAGFNAWKRMGNPVRKGAKAIWVWAPLLKSRKDENENGDNTRVSLIGFKPVCVFDVKDTVNPDFLPSIFSPLDGDYSAQIESMLELIRSFGVPVKFDSEGRANGYAIKYQNGSVEIHVRNDMDSGNLLNTLIHEFAHCLLHLGIGDVVPKDRVVSYEEGEWEAQSTAFIVSYSLGLDVTWTQDYLINWNGNVDLLSGHLDVIQRTARFIQERLMVKDSLQGVA